MFDWLFYVDVEWFNVLSSHHFSQPYSSASSRGAVSLTSVHSSSGRLKRRKKSKALLEKQPSLRARRGAITPTDLHDANPAGGSETMILYYDSRNLVPQASKLSIIIIHKTQCYRLWSFHSKFKAPIMNSLTCLWNFHSWIVIYHSFRMLRFC